MLRNDHPVKEGDLYRDRHLWTRSKTRANREPKLEKFDQMPIGLYVQFLDSAIV
jgi:hypothetical protein